jgi:putative peptidoglycan lipid II flippase
MNSNSIFKNVAKITSARLCNNIIAFILDAFILAKFGLSKETDVFFLSLTLPLILITLAQIQSGAVQTIFVHIRQKKGAKYGWEYLNKYITLSLMFIISMIILCIFGSNLIISIQAPGFEQQQTEYAAKIFVLLMISLLFFYQFTIYHKILNSFGHFFFPETMVALEHTLKIIALIVFSSSLGILSIAVGIVAGSILKLSIVVFCLYRKGYLFRPNLNFCDSEIKKTLKMIFFPTAGSFLTDGAQVLENILLSYFSDGSITAIRISRRILTALTKLASGGIPIIVMPNAAKDIAKNSIENMKKTLRNAIEIYFLIMIPLALGLAVVCEPLISIVYERGAFNQENVLLISNIILVLIPTLILSRYPSIVETTFWGNLDTWTPFKVLLTRAVFYIGLVLITIKYFGVYSIPFSETVARITSSTYITYLFHAKYRISRSSETVKKVFKIALSAISMAIAVFFLKDYLLSHINALNRAFEFSILTVAGIFIYAIITFKLKLTDQLIYDLVKKVKS